MDVFYPVELFADWFTYTVVHLVPASLLAEAVHFFVYDSIKIMILLVGIIFTVSVIRSFLPRVVIRRLLAQRRGYAGNVLAGLLGIMTPFCSCSAVPLFLGFIEAGVPLGITFSFLVASPMINEVALVLLAGMFGWKIALVYVASGFAIAVGAGICIGTLRVEGLLMPYGGHHHDHTNDQLHTISWSERFADAWGYTRHLVRKIWPYVFFGIGLGAWIHGYVPADFLVQYASADHWYAVPLATLLGVPLYANAAGVIPLVGALVEKGVNMGTALAFMMAVTGLSLPEFLILKKVMRARLLAIFAGVVATGIMFTGYVFNFLLA